MALLFDVLSEQLADSQGTGTGNQEPVVRESLVRAVPAQELGDRVRRVGEALPVATGSASHDEKLGA